MILIELIIEFLKVGTFAIGGYSTMAVVVDIITKKGWLNEKEIADIIALAESTPGPIAVNFATYIGSIRAGIPGSIVATLAEIFPAFVIIIIVSYVMEKIVKNKVINNAFTIIRPAMTGIIIATGITLLLKNTFNIENIKYIKNIKNILNNKTGLIIFIIILILTLVYKKIKNKEINTILLIVISAFVGIIVNGVA